MKKVVLSFVAAFTACVCMAAPCEPTGFALRHGGSTLIIDKPTSILDYCYILTTPNFELRGYDGIPDPEKSKGLHAINWSRPLSLAALPKFAFFDGRPTTVGILTGSAGASGGSSQSITLMDTASARRIQLELSEMATPNWIVAGEAIVGVREMRWDYLGSRALGLGMNSRLDHCVFFDNSDAHAEELAYFKAKFAKLSFSTAELKDLQRPLTEVGRGAGEKFVDYVYYGTRAGKHKSVSTLVDRVGHELKVEALAFVARLRKESSGDGAVKDYVSEYDFDSAQLEDLPWEMAAAVAGSSAVLDYAPFVARHYSGWNYVQYSLSQDHFVDLCYVPADSTNDIHVVDDPVAVAVEYRAVDPQCRLTDGELAGELQCVDGIVILDDSAPRHFQLSVEVLGYEDVNADGFMDVLVRRSLPGSACPVEDLALSRMRPDGMFYVVEITARRIREADQEGAGFETGWDLPEPRTDDAHGNAQIHMVYPGETVSDIARQYGVSEAALRTANGLSAEGRVLAGQRLRVPGP